MNLKISNLKEVDMDIQGLIRLAYQADLEGNYKVADNLTERAIREAKARWKLNAEAKGIDFGNVSNEVLRTCGDKEVYDKICEAFRPVVDEHIAVYGAHNDQRIVNLTHIVLHSEHY